MTALARLKSLVHALFHQRRLEQEMEQEWRTHLDARVDALVASGLSRAEAQQRARIEFGDPLRWKEQGREARGLRWLYDLRADARHAVRQMRRTPGFTVVVVTTLALGIGANTALFTVVNAVVIKPLAAPDAHRLVRSVTVNNGVALPISSAATLKVWLDHRSTFEDVSAHRFDSVNLTGDRDPELIPVARVSEPFFRLFRAPVIMGRTFTAEEDRPNGPPVAVLSHGLWMRRFGGTPSAVGRTLSLGSIPHVIVGVIGSDFDSEQFEPRPEVWVPLQADPERVDGASIYQVTARLRPGVTHAAADAQLRVALDATAPVTTPADRRSAWTARPLHDAMVGRMQSSFNLLFGAVALLLLIACANVASLLLVRADVRRREMAIRAAIGAGRGRIVRQTLVENLLLSLAGGLVGLIVGPLAIRTLLRLYPGTNPFIIGGTGPAIPRIGEGGAAVALDWHVLGFALLLSMATGLLCGLIPAWHVSRADVSATLQHTNVPASGTRRATGRSVLVMSEIALAVLLVVAAGLLIRTSLAMRSIDPGFDRENVLTMRMAVTGTRFETRDGISELARNGIAQVQTIPGVLRASTTCCMPLETVWQLPFVIASRAGEGVTRRGGMSFHGFGGWTFVSPGYFEVFRVPMLRGRDFSEHDDARAPGVAIINEAMARVYWPAGDPLDDRLIIGRGMRPAYEQDPVRQIVGIVGNVRDTGLTQNARPAMYVPMAQVPDAVTAPNVKLLPLVWITRTAVAPYAVSEQMSKALESASGGLPVGRVRAMRDVVSESTARARFDTSLMALFGGCALVLAAVGVYGLLAYWVQQRSREIAIRLALGAEAASIARMVVWQGIRLAMVGVALGVLGAFGTTRLVASFLFGVGPRDPIVFGAIPLLMAVVSLMAVWMPARRATKVDPLDALKCE
jgi:predicted permease